jgi:tetratricopeptide (TPR) repeat protein
MTIVWSLGLAWTAVMMMFYLEGYFSARFLYAPLAGMALAAALLYDQLIAARPALQKPVLAVCGVLLVAYGAVTLRQIPLWHDDVAAYQGVTKAAPEGTVGFLNLGYILMGKGDSAGADQNFQMALQNAHIARVRAEALVALGTLAGMNNDLPRSAQYLNEAAQIDPRSSPAWTGLGNLAWMQGQIYEAIPLYEKALAINPRNREAASNLANAYDQTGQHEREAALRNSMPR